MDRSACPHVDSTRDDMWQEHVILFGGGVHDGVTLSPSLWPGHCPVPRYKERWITAGKFTKVCLSVRRVSAYDPSRTLTACHAFDAHRSRASLPEYHCRCAPTHAYTSGGCVHCGSLPYSHHSCRCARHKQATQTGGEYMDICGRKVTALFSFPKTGHRLDRQTAAMQQIADPICGTHRALA